MTGLVLSPQCDSIHLPGFISKRGSLMENRTEKYFHIIPTQNHRSTENLHLKKAEKKQGGDVITHYTLINSGDDIEIDFIQPLIFQFETNLPKKEIRFFVNGFTSFSGSGSFHLEEKEIDSRIPNLRQLHRNFHLSSQKRKGFLTSSMLGALQLTSDTWITMGFLDCRHYFTQVKTEVYDNRILMIAQIQCEGLTISRGQHLSLPSLFISRGAPFTALVRYAAALAGSMGVKTEKIVPNGWCSWYHYFTKINETEFLKNLDLAKAFEPGFDIFQLDDGYQPVLGECSRTNLDFPSGLRKLARRVTDAGFSPGIWTAPFLVQRKTPIVKDHPEWLLRDRRGKPVKGMWNPNWGVFRYAYVLDISRTEVTDYLADLYQTLYRYGFRFFKLDFLFAAALPGEYHQAGKTSLHILRNGLSIIRKAVQDALILGCGCPLEAGIGIVDSMRVGNDVTPYWSNWIDKFVGRGFEQLSTKNCLRNTLTRGFMHGRLFQNDPDCLITRRKNNRLTPMEISTLAQINALSGGPLMISDDLKHLRRESVDLLETIFQLQLKIRSKDRFFTAPDFLERRIPQIQIALGKYDAYLGVYNFSGKPERRIVDLSKWMDWKAYTVVDDHTGKRIEIKNHVLETRIIRPHGALLFHIRKIGR